MLHGGIVSYSKRKKNGHDNDKCPHSYPFVILCAYRQRDRFSFLVFYYNIISVVSGILAVECAHTYISLIIIL